VEELIKNVKLTIKKYSTLKHLDTTEKDPR